MFYVLFSVVIIRFFRAVRMAPHEIAPEEEILEFLIHLLVSGLIYSLLLTIWHL